MGLEMAQRTGQVKNIMTLSVKKEVFTLDEYYETSERARAIWCMHPSMMLLSGYFNAIMIKTLKQVLPSFIHGHSNESLEQKLNSEIPLDWVQLAADTSGHDAS